MLHYDTHPSSGRFFFGENSCNGVPKSEDIFTTLFFVTRLESLILFYAPVVVNDNSRCRGNTLDNVT